MLPELPEAEVATVRDADPSCALGRKPQECARIVRASRERHRIG
jgi:hypothetical protein